MNTTGRAIEMHEGNIQPAVLLPVPRVARYLTFSLRKDTAPTSSREALRALDIDDRCVVGIGAPLVAHWGSNLEGLPSFPALSGPSVQIPSTQQALWCWLRGKDRGELVLRSRSISATLAKAFQLEQVIDAFKFGDNELGLDLTGYEDGTENPTGADAANAAITSALPGLPAAEDVDLLFADFADSVEYELT